MADRFGISNLESRLDEMWSNQCAILAGRVALRVLPLLTVRPAHAIDSAGVEAAFSFWQPAQRGEYLFALLRAIALAEFAACDELLSERLADRIMLSCREARQNTHAGEFEQVQPRHAIEGQHASHERFGIPNRPAIAIVKAALYAAHVACAFADELHAVNQSSTEEEEQGRAFDAWAVACANSAIENTLICIRSARYACKSLRVMNAGDIWQSFALEIDADIDDLAKFPVRHLLSQPVWRNPAPSCWLEILAQFKTDVQELDGSFSTWLAWYQQRLDGHDLPCAEVERILDLPLEIQAQSLPAINAYIAATLRHTQAKPLKRVRAIFIGYGEAGKTSLIRALHAEAVIEGKEEMTPGIAIREWRGAGDGLITHMWDFGGQVVAHATHQFFLRSHCLYVLVLSARAEINANEQAQYWLQHVQAFGGDAPVMLVGNKADQTELLLDMAALREKFPNIVGFFSLSCTKVNEAMFRYRFEDFNQVMCQQLKKLTHAQVLFSPSQFALLEQLQQQANSTAFLQRSHFEHMCDQHCIAQEGELNRDWLLDILDKLGVVIHFKNLHFLDEFVLNPRWLTYGVYALMHVGQAYLNHARIVQILAQAQLLDENLQPLRYPVSKCGFIAQAMQEFKLCYVLPQDQQQLIIPSLLPSDTPASLAQQGFQKAQALAYKMRFEGFVPRHVLPELIVERNHEIVNGVVWQTGVLLENTSLATRALLQVDYAARHLCIWLQTQHSGDGARDYLAQLRTNFRLILRRLELPMQECIRLPAQAMLHAASSRHSEDWADYEQIEQHRRHGKSEYISPQGVYDLARIAGLYLPRSAEAKSGDQYHFYGNQPQVHQSHAHHIDNRSHTMSSQHVNITGSTVNGPVVVADKIEHSQIGNIANAPDPQQLMQELLKAIAELAKQAPPAEAAKMADIHEEANAIAVEQKREPPRPYKIGASMQGIVEAAQSMGAVAKPVLQVAQQLVEFFAK